MKPIRMNQIGAMNLIYKHHSLSFFLGSLDRLGIGQFELYAPTTQFDLNMPHLGNVSDFRELIRKRGLKITCVTPDQCFYPHNIAEKDADARKYAISHFIRYIDATSELEVDKMLCGAGWGNVDEDADEAWKRSVDSLYQMIRHAEKRGVNLAFEILNKYESNLAFNLTTMKRVATEIQSPRFKFCIDTVPLGMENQTLETYFRTFGDQIIHIHMTDGNPIGHVPPGLGRFNMEPHFETLAKYEYDGYITIEIEDISWSNDPEKGTLIGYKTLKKAMSAVNSRILN